MKRLTLTLVAISLGIATGRCGTAKVSSQREISATPTNQPTVIYVADFDLDAADIKSEKRLLPAPPKLPVPFGNGAPSLPCSTQDPQKLARKLVDELSDALVKNLTQAGITARRLQTGETFPTTGWLVRGVFTEVNQGNQLQRAVIGFGKGKTDLQVLVDIADLSQGSPKDFYELKTTAHSSKLPGAGPMIAVNPAGLAVRFVIAGKDLDRNIKQTASKISAQVFERTKPSATTRQAAL